MRRMEETRTHKWQLLTCVSPTHSPGFSVVATWSQLHNQGRHKAVLHSCPGMALGPEVSASRERAEHRGSQVQVQAPPCQSKETQGSAVPPVRWGQALHRQLWEPASCLSSTFPHSRPQPHTLTISQCPKCVVSCAERGSEISGHWDSFRSLPVAKPPPWILSPYRNWTTMVSRSCVVMQCLYHRAWLAACITISMHETKDTRNQHPR